MFFCEILAELRHFEVFYLSEKKYKLNNQEKMDLS